jgi:hypothetical protein
MFQIGLYLDTLHNMLLLIESQDLKTIYRHHTAMRLENIGLADYRMCFGVAIHTCKRRWKAIPLEAWAGPESSRNFKLPNFKTIGT